MHITITAINISEHTAVIVAHAQTLTHIFKHSAPQPSHKTISPGILERRRRPYRAELPVSEEHQ